MSGRIPTKKTIADTHYIGVWKNTNIPVYDVLSMAGLNEIIGYVKHSNAQKGTVLYRGQCKLYEHIYPSISRDLKTQKKDMAKLNNALDNLIQDKYMDRKMEWNVNVAGWELYMKTIYESLLQHYGAKTKCVDFVDNHWVALWFALFKFNKSEMKYVRRTSADIDDDCDKIDFNPFYPQKAKPLKRRNPSSGDKRKQKEYENWKKRVEEAKIEFAERNKLAHAYIFLYWADTSVSEFQGMYFGEETTTIDLRKAVPEFFVRPTSQHGWIVKGNSENYLFDKDVLCVLRLSVDLIDLMLGEGTLLSQDNFLPKPNIDEGYKLLLSRQVGSKFVNKSCKTLLEKDMITEYLSSEK